MVIQFKRDPLKNGRVSRAVEALFDNAERASEALNFPIYRISPVQVATSYIKAPPPPPAPDGIQRFDRWMPWTRSSGHKTSLPRKRNKLLRKTFRA